MNCSESCSRGGARRRGRLTRDHAAVGALRVAREGALVGLAGASSPTAQPQGLLCLTIAQAGSSNSSTSSRAELRSSRLLNDSSLPCSWLDAVEQVRRRADARVEGGAAGAGSRRSAGRSPSRRPRASVGGKPSYGARARTTSRSRRRSGRCRRTPCAARRRARRERQPPVGLAQLGEHGVVVGRVDDHRGEGAVLGGRADHRRAADVDVLDRSPARLASPRATVCSNG